MLENLRYGEYRDLINFSGKICRGLDIYTGFIVETNLTFDVKNLKGKVIAPGSVASGGEYLVSKFKGDNFLGSGVSIGISRLTYCVEQLNQIKADESKPVLICVMDENLLPKYYELLNLLRNNNINSEIFLDPKKNLTKQLTYANKRQLQLAVIVGENEAQNNTATIKNLSGIKGEENQFTVLMKDLIDEIKKFTKNN